MMSLAFYSTGRVLSNFGVRRIRQNVRHFMEIMLPGSVLRGGEGWKLSVRIRLVHAQIRRLFRESGEWDADKYGVPLHSAHMGLAAGNFSAGVLHHAERLRARTWTLQAAPPLCKSGGTPRGLPAFRVPYCSMGMKRELTRSPEPGLTANLFPTTSP